MTVEELGGLVKDATTAVIDRDFVAALGLVGKANLAVQEFIHGFQNPPRGTPDGAADLDPLHAQAGDLLAACDAAAADGSARNAPRGFNPMWIPVILDAVRALARLIRELRDNKPLEAEPAPVGGT